LMLHGLQNKKKVFSFFILGDETSLEDIIKFEIFVSE
jgi:hypothetical protein